MEKCKKAISLLLSLVLLLQAAPVMQAETAQIPLAEVEIGEDILTNDLFYLASTSATLREGANEAYLLRVGRGGSAETESSVLVKISDVTAQYGRDYTVSVPDGSAEVEVPEGNFSLMELLQSSDYEQTELKDEAEAEAILEEDEEGMSAATEGMKEALSFLADASGIKLPNAETELDEVQQARNLFTGVEGTSQQVTAENEMFRQMQDVADVMTALVPGAELRLTFAPGETEKLLLLKPADNREGDGERMFYLILSQPEGTTTNSAASSCAVTIVDDEEQTPSAMRFSQETYSEIQDGMLTVTVEREGALNSVAAVTVKTTEGSAEAGRDYAEVDRELLFPFGISSLDIQIPVRTDFLSKNADFGLTLVPTSACTAGPDARAVLQLNTQMRDGTDAEEPELEEPDTVVNSLLTVKTGEAINIVDPEGYSNTYGYCYCGQNEYDNSKGAWTMHWDEDALFSSDEGTNGAIWALDGSYEPVWYTGARVSMETSDAHGSNDHHALIGVCVSGEYILGSALSDFQDPDNEDAKYFSYRHARAFGDAVVDFYISEATATDASFSNRSAKYISIFNQALCDDCTYLWISKIQPILRPFQIRLVAAEPMLFLDANGNYVPDTKVATAAYLKDAVEGKVVYFLDDSATVVQPAASNAVRYSRLTGLEFVADGKPESKGVRIVDNQNLSGKTATLKLTKNNLQSMFVWNGGVYKSNDSLLNWYKDDESSHGNYQFYGNGYSWNYPTYGDVPLRPTFDYIDAKVTLQNPYEIPICYTISGTEYWIEPKGSYEIPNLHLGDTLSISSLRVGPGYESDFKGDGVNFYYAFSDATGTLKDGSRRFVDGNPIIIGGADDRLCYQTLIISPIFTEKDNQITVRVKNTDVSKFQKSGIFAQQGVRNGSYTEYVLADADQIIPGRIYPISATPVNANALCVWTVYSGYRYLGNTLLFEAGRATVPEENVIQLSLVSASSELRLTGTLTYMDYNLRDLETGGASTRPVSGAVVTAGNMAGQTDEKGVLETNTMKIPSSPQRYRVRCLISANGASILRDLQLPSSGKELNITQTFDSGLSPVLSPIYRTVRVECDRADYDGLIPLKTTGNSAMYFKIYVSPVVYTSQLGDGEGGYVNKTYYEKPMTVQLVTLDASGRERRAWDVVSTATVNAVTGEYEFDCRVPYILRVKDTVTPDMDPEIAEELSKDDTVVFSMEPGDTFYLRLTTDLLDEASGLEVPKEILDQLNGSDALDPVVPMQVKQFTYSEVNTGLSIYAPPSYVVPVKQGLNDPISIDFARLDLLGDIGMNLQFPFVNIGYMAIDRGYRIYIGISPLQIVDAKLKMDKPLTKFVADDGRNYGDLFSMANPISSFGKGLATSFQSAFQEYGDAVGKNGVKDKASLGAAQWKFDFTLGVYFDFFLDTVTVSGVKYTDYIFSGIGGYVSVSVGFKKAWYTIIPVVFIPAYIGVQINATVLGFFGVQRSGDPPEVITYDDATKKPGLRFEGQFNDEFNWAVLGTGTFQLSLGVGLCGTIGIRLVGEVGIIANYEPSDVEGIRDWGCYLNFRAGGMIDLFLYTHPIMYDIVGRRYGKFADWEQKSGQRSTEAEIAQDDGSFLLRDGSEQTSEWLGNGTAKRGAFTPKQTYTLVENGYEHSDPQLITLKNGTVVLAYLSNDPNKGEFQRTTLMLTTYRDGVWTEPVAVSEDGTADFQPSIAETNDGRVLLAWVSTEADDITDETTTADYLRQMEIYAAFAEVGADGSVTVGETARISHDQRIKDGETQPRHYYDSNPTVVCDTNSGDAIVYFIKSGSAAADEAALANPYTNDSVICYLPWDGAKGKWMTDEFYENEMGSPASEQYLIDNFCGQRFLDAPTFENASGGREYYAIPDFTAISYNGLAVYAYTVDRDSSNDTDADKEMFLQVYSFKDHGTYYRIRLTDDVVPDSMPQLFRSRQVTGNDKDEVHTKLFWYRNGNVCWLDVSSLLRDGINPDGTIKDDPSGYGNCAQPVLVASARANSEQSNQMADFRVAEDAEGRLYVIWTENVPVDGSIVGAQEIYAIGYNTTVGEEDGSASWSKPYRLTNSGLQNDEVVLTLVGEDLLLVHNQYQMELTEDENAPIKISDMRLAATTLEPCGSVVTQDVTLTFEETKLSEQGAVMHTPVTLPQSGDGLHASLQIANNGLTTAEGYHVDVYAVRGEQEERIWSYDSDTRLLPNTFETLAFDWTLPEAFDGMFLRVETQENHYQDRDSYETASFEARANYVFSEVGSYQAADGFHLTATLTNTGNLPTQPGDELTLTLTGPYDMDRLFSAEARELYRAQAPTLAVGESRTVDLVLDVPTEMMARYGYINTCVRVEREQDYPDPAYTDTWTQTLGDDELVEFKLTRPMRFTLLDGQDLTLAVGEEKQLTATMELSDLVGGEEIAYSVADPNVARIENGVLIAAAEGQTTVYATHVPTGATVSLALTVSGEARENPFDDVAEDQYYFEPVLWAYYHDPQITTGTSETTFSPNGAATRGQVVTFLWRAAGCPEPAARNNPFTDVKDDVYYYNAVLWAVEQGITNGTSDTTFSPNKTCTRGEFVTFLWRLAGCPESAVADGSPVQNPFTDVKEDAYYYNPVLWAVEQGVTQGTSDTTFSPNQKCTRGQIVTFLYRYLGE